MSGDSSFVLLVNVSSTGGGAEEQLVVADKLSLLF